MRCCSENLQTWALAHRGPRVADLFDIGRPTLDWVHLAKGMGVPASRVSTLDAFSKAMREGFEGDGPKMIEVPV
jgi:acetolactate synthase-1/2/3 large subunit